jgi:hypothetical protein
MCEPTVQKKTPLGSVNLEYERYKDVYEKVTIVWGDYNMHIYKYIESSRDTGWLRLGIDEGDWSYDGQLPLYGVMDFLNFARQMVKLHYYEDGNLDLEKIFNQLQKEGNNG